MGSWTFNADGFDYWSPELFRIHGLDPNRKAPTVDEYMALVHPEDREFVAQAIQKLLADNRSFDFSKRIVRPDGEIRHVRCVGTAATHGGTFGGFVGTGVDVTEQEQLTEELRRSDHYLRERERELRQILDLTPQHLGVLGPDGSPLYANRAALDYFVNIDQWRAESRIDPRSSDDREHFLGERKTRFLQGAS
jgi:PAS domain S-box-containing protein